MRTGDRIRPLSPIRARGTSGVRTASPSGQGVRAAPLGAARRIGRMRIAFVSLHTSPIQTPSTGDAGGLNVYLLELARSLGRHGHEVQLITRATDPADPAVLPVAPGVELRALRAGPVGPLAKEELPGITDAFAAALAALPPADVVHAHYWLSAVAALPVARAWGVPHVLTLHSVSAGKNRRLVAGTPRSPPRGSRTRAARARVGPRGRVRGVGEAAARGGLRRGSRRGARRGAWRGGGVLRSRRAATAGAGADRAARADPAAQGPGRRAASPRPAGSRDPAPARDRRRGLTRPGRVRGEPARARAVARPEDDVLFAGALDRAATARVLAGAHLALMPSAAETYGLVALGPPRAARPSSRRGRRDWSTRCGTA